MSKVQAAGAAAKRKLIDEGTKKVTDWQTEKAKLEDELAIKRAELLRRQRKIVAHDKTWIRS